MATKKTNSKNAPKKKNKILWFDFRTLALVFLFFGIAAQMKHFYYGVNEAFSKATTAAQTEVISMDGLLFCLAFGGAILFYTARGRKEIVFFFTCIEIAINLYYASKHSITGSDYLTIDFAMGVLLGIVLPISNLFYGEEMMFGNSHASVAKKKKTATKPVATSTVPATI